MWINRLLDYTSCGGFHNPDVFQEITPTNIFILLIVYFYFFSNQNRFKIQT